MSERVADEMSIGQLAKETGLSTATINYYVAEGVLPAPRKLNRTRAAYAPKHLRMLRLVKQMQTSGYTLQQVKTTFQAFGVDEKGLRKLEDIGSIKALPPPKTDPDQRPIERFAPVDEAAFLKKAGCTRDLLRALVHRRILLPAEKGKYDASDLWALRFMQTLLAEGLTLDELELFTELQPFARKAVPLMFKRAIAHRDALAARKLRYRDLVEPFQTMTAYAFERAASEADPEWRTAMFKRK
jgi:DNA-binding transcriptional MerR regulator